MVIDSSALIAIILEESDLPGILQRLADDPVRLMSAASLLECEIVLHARGGIDNSRDLDEIITRLRVEIVAFDEKQASLARAAFRTFGKGRHPAKLNFGDCMTYALAQSTSEPLLFKGDDFNRTDLPLA
jgi:ribonuclease VapC